MSFPALLVLVLPLLVVAVGAVALTAAPARPDSTLASEVVSARRHASVTSLLAVVAMSATVIVPVAAALVTDAGLAPRIQACLPLAATAVALVVLLVGELTWPRPHGSTRTAVLHDRSVATVLHRRWAAAAASVTGATVLLLVTGGLLGSVDGRSISRTTPVTVESAGPFPGWDYTVPQLAALALCLVLVGSVARAALRRSTVVSASVDVDRVLRRASTARALRAVVVGSLLTLGPDLVFGGLAAHNVVGGGLPTAVSWTAVALGLACVGGAAVACALPVPRLTTPVPPIASRLPA
jgi:hypothetical protein